MKGSGTITARQAYARAVLTKTNRSRWQLTSNEANFTRDLAKRSIVVRNRKQAEGYAAKSKTGWGDGVFDYIREHQGQYLGAVYTVVGEWISRGKLRTNETRHDFRGWVQTLDYIVQEILGLPPLMDDHQGAQKVISDPSFIWLRTLVLKLAETNQIPIKMGAGQIGDFCELQGITIPSLNDGADQKKRNQHIGTLLGKIFEKPDYPEEDMVTVEEYRVRRQQIPGTKHGTEKSYLFNKSPLHALLLDSP